MLEFCERKFPERKKNSLRVFHKIASSFYPHGSFAVETSVAVQTTTTHDALSNDAESMEA